MELSLLLVSSCSTFISVSSNVTAFRIFSLLTSITSSGEIESASEVVGEMLNETILQVFSLSTSTVSSEGIVSVSEGVGEAGS